MEFGSDYHRINNYPFGSSPHFLTGKFRLYTNGRQALEAILLKEHITRIWVPSYYCHESLAGVKQLGVDIEFYPCTPLCNADKVTNHLPFKHGDALLRMNYFGLQCKPKTTDQRCLLIEDHSHSLSGSWIKSSDADWCFASLRKTLPIADGGALWSPRGRALPVEPKASTDATENAIERYAAMNLKADYLSGAIIDKELFLNKLRRTEENFEKLRISAISNKSKEIVETIDIDEWNRRKKENWNILCEKIMTGSDSIFLRPEKESEIPFSLIMLFRTSTLRDTALKRMIAYNVYPAVLWRIPPGNDHRSIDFGERILSIHCDARYTQEQIKDLVEIVNKSINKA